MKISELKEKHDHALTNWLKVIIFSLLMIAPLFASISQWIYVACNKNAKDSYSGLNQNTETIVNVNTINDFDYSKTYYLGNSILNTAPSSASSSAYMYFDSINIIKNNTSTSNEIVSQFDRMYIYASSTTMFYNFYAENTNYTFNSGQDFLLEVKIRSFNGTNEALQILNNNLTNSNMLYYINYYNEQQLDNAFYYGVEKMTQSDLFNWTQNTTLYTGIKTMTDNLEIQTPAIAILLTYWFILTIIYVIIDIVLKGFTTLTHLIMGAKN